MQQTRISQINRIGTSIKMPRKEIQDYITQFNEDSQDTPEDLQDKANAFWDNLKNWKCVNDDGTYDLLAYSKKYCMMDCEVLKIGMEKWEKLWRDIDNRIDVNKFYSLPSLADYYFKINDCFFCDLKSDCWVFTDHKISPDFKEKHLSWFSISITKALFS